MSIIGQIGIFMICAQAILHFRPKESYGKYLRLLFSVMILVQIFQPFCTFFLDTGTLNLKKRVQEFQKRMDQSMEEALLRASESEKQLEEMSLKAVQEKLARQQDTSVDVDESIEITPIERIYITQEEQDE